MPKPDLTALRNGGALLSQVLAELAKQATVGVTTKQLDEYAEQTLRNNGGTPAFLGHHGFPATLCTSVNDQIVHGIPDDRPLADGDVLSIDVGVKVDGWYTDAAVSIGIGKLSKQAGHLLAVTRESLEVALQEVKAGNTTGDMGAAVQKFVEAHDCSVIRDCVGHGIGRKLHEEPSIPNYGQAGTGADFKRDMVVAIEPMVVIGDPATKVGADRWTISSRDGSLAAHFEETVVVTSGKPERLTALPDSLPGVATPDKLGKVA